MLKDSAPDAGNPSQGLRGRKKTLRRQEILSSARQLFAKQGVEAATIAEIAEMAGVSPPTIFNYFGSKENILLALLFEGTEQKRAGHLKPSSNTGQPFAEIAHKLFCEITENIMQIAGKRVWRFAEATNIRRPDTEFGRKFYFSDNALLTLITDFFGEFDIVLRQGDDADHALVVKLFYDRWTARYFEFIKDDEMSREAHSEALREDIEALVALLLTTSSPSIHP